MDFPPGQIPRSDFPRFGLTPYAKRFPRQLENRSLLVAVQNKPEVLIEDAFDQLDRVKLTADFHCVTTWSAVDLKWSGVKFHDFYTQRIEPLVSNSVTINAAVLFAQDGYKTSLPLEDLMADDVLIVDKLNNQALSIEHGAPLRLVAPKHYGYKNLKHLSRIEFYSHMPSIKRGIKAFLDHPRARVQQEERGRWLPGWLLRHVYRPFIKQTEKQFRKEMQQHQETTD